MTSFMLACVCSTSKRSRAKFTFIRLLSSMNIHVFREFIICDKTLDTYFTFVFLLIVESMCRLNMSIHNAFANYKVIYQGLLTTKPLVDREFQFVYMFSSQSHTATKETKWFEIAVFELNRTI